MSTDIHPVAPAAVIDRELRAQTGAGLAAWCADRALAPAAVVAALEGRGALAEAVRAELAATLGVAPAALPGADRRRAVGA